MHLKIQKIVLSGLLCAVITLLTMFVSFPIPGVTGAYVNAGDAGVYLAGFLLGGPLGALCAGVGSALADLLLGFAMYAVPTFIIKGAVALITALLLKKFSGWSRIFALLIAGALIPAGYFLWEWLFLYGFETALVSVPFNLIQYAGGILVGFILINALERIQKKQAQ
ncbi:MAG: Thiamine precursor transporter HmpT [Firmicutes bacterium ADurb.Bin182]|nr:MAG: Thiamine precursor transporter HmpT [Firmicutes bacterium ADurb.Bin182]